MPKPINDIVCKALPASERAKILGREIKAAIASGEFDFAHGYFQRILKPEDKTCSFGGCALGALAYVLGSRPAYGAGYVLGSRCREESVDTGLVTQKEVWALENAYEGGKDHDGPFAKLGRELRELADKRGGRWNPNDLASHGGGTAATPYVTVANRDR